MSRSRLAWLKSAGFAASVPRGEAPVRSRGERSGTRLEPASSLNSSQEDETEVGGFPELR